MLMLLAGQNRLNTEWLCDSLVGGNRVENFPAYVHCKHAGKKTGSNGEGTEEGERIDSEVLD